MADFVTLHAYSGYSFLQSGLSLGRIVSLSLKAKRKYVCLSDNLAMTGYPELTALCAQAGQTPVYALDLEYEGDTLTFVIQSEEGYRNAIKLLFLASKNELSKEALSAHNEGLIVVLDARESKLFYTYHASLEEAAPYLFALSKLFSSFYVGIPYLPKKPEFVDDLRSFLANHSYDTVAFPSLRYEKEGDAIVLSIVKAIANEDTLEDKQEKGSEYFLSDETIESYFTPEERKATLDIASSSSFIFQKKRGGLLVYPHPEGMTSGQYLREKAEEGLKAKGKLNDPLYVERLNYELSIIDKMGYSDYFLIVADYVRFAKTHGILVGPGRGSGAGSLVSYSLGIVSPDPIRYDLLFERFLNPERQSMPDIDVDFADIRREEVVSYIQQKYGHERVSHIVTMQTLGARASIRDIGRVYGYDSRQIDLLAKSVEFPMESLRNNYRKSEKFRKLVDSDPYYLEIVSLAAKIEGLPRQSGLHAAGVVLNDAPLDEAIPVKDDANVGLVANYEMTYLEDQGFLKMDILGLRNLTLVDDCLRLIKQNQGIELYYEDIPYDDKEAVELIAKNKTMGLFQLESGGMNRAIAEIKPTSFEDIVAVIALYRPGPMDNIPVYGRRKAGKEKVTYLSPKLEKILAPTYGIIVYQEQVMQIVRELAGFSYGQADSFRRAISKKDAAKLGALESAYIKGCLQNGVSQDVAKKSYDLIFKFANYGFNKSHALVYAYLACQMAYLKKHYPIEFYSAILNGTSSSDPKFAPLVTEIKSSGYSFALPDINQAGLSFLPKGNKIMFPLSSIKGIQGALVSAIVDERTMNGPFKDFFDFASRAKPCGLTENSLIKLIDAGCFDSLDSRRATLRLGSTRAMDYAEMLFGSSGNEILLSLDLPKPSLEEIQEDKMLDLMLEKESIGLMVSGSPLRQKEREIAEKNLKNLASLDNVAGEARVAAIISNVKPIVTKKGSKMAFVSLYDEERAVEMTMFADGYDISYPSLKEGNPVAVTCRKDNYRGSGFVAIKIEVI